MDFESYKQQAEASELTWGIIPHPAASPLKSPSGLPFSNPLDVALHGSSSSSYSPSSSNGGGSGCLGYLLAAWLLCAFLGGVTRWSAPTRLTPAPQPVVERVVSSTPTPLATPPPVAVVEATPEPEPAAVAERPEEVARWAARHQGPNCDGELILTAAALEFRCPANPARDFQLARTNVLKLDKNGVKARIGRDGRTRNFHFKIEGLDKQQTRNVLGRWLGQAPGTDSLE